MLSRIVRWPAEGRNPRVSDRALALSMSGRFVDEILSGAWSVLTPTFRRHFHLSLVQVGLLDQVLDWVALVIEPPASLLIDVRSRRVLLAFGATCVGLSTLLMGLAPTYAALLTAFALYGLGSGPLAHTSDVVNIEAYPDDPERAFGRATFIDTFGALIAPAVVAVTGWAGLPWQGLLVVLGALTLIYAWAIGATAFPAPAARETEHHLIAELWANIRLAVSDRRARAWLLVLLALDLYETADVLEYVWLVEHVGMTQAQVAAYAVGENVVGLAALAWLDRRLESGPGRGILPAAAVATLVLGPAWVLAPGIVPRLIIAVPLAFAWSLFWPIAKARSLASIPGKSGAVNAVTTTFSLLPLAIVFSGFAEATTITTAMLVTGIAGSVAILAASLWAERA